MIPHGRDELIALAERSVIEQAEEVEGWHVDRWIMDDHDVDMAVVVYAAVLAGGATDPVAALLAESGLDLTALLNDAEHSKDDITRSDLTELVAAASMVAVPGCDPDVMYMPNVPKMSRRKSDSGIDIFVVRLEDTPDLKDLAANEQLIIASVKHSISENSASGLRWKLAESLSARELSVAYMTGQLRVLCARLKQEGISHETASRAYLFLRDFPDPDNIDLFAIGIVDSDLEGDLAHQVRLLAPARSTSQNFRMILLPGLRNVHERCPLCLRLIFSSHVVNCVDPDCRMLLGCLTTA